MIDTFVLFLLAASRRLAPSNYSTALGLAAPTALPIATPWHHCYPWSCCSPQPDLSPVTLLVLLRILRSARTLASLPRTVRLPPPPKKKKKRQPACSVCTRGRGGSAGHTALRPPGFFFFWERRLTVRGKEANVRADRRILSITRSVTGDRSGCGEQQDHG